MAIFEGLLPPFLDFLGFLLGILLVFVVARLVYRMIREVGRG